MRNQIMIIVLTDSIAPRAPMTALAVCWKSSTVKSSQLSLALSIIVDRVSVKLPCNITKPANKHDSVKFKDFSRTSKRLFYCFQGLKT